VCVFVLLSKLVVKLDGKICKITKLSFLCEN
jgi:hypothetical protein